jgi:hypothetical protein
LIHLKNKLREKDDSDLQKIGVDYGKYTLETLKQYLHEIERRGLPLNSLNSLKNHIFNLEIKAYRDSKYHRPPFIWGKVHFNNSLVKESKIFRYIHRKEYRKYCMTLQLTNIKTTVDHPILCILCQTDHLPIDRNNSFVANNWFDLAVEILTITFYHLTQAKLISVDLFQNEYTYFNCIKIKNESCEITAVESSVSIDFLSAIIIEEIHSMNQQKPTNLDLDTILKMVLNRIIGTEQLFEPDKEFVVNTLSLYSDNLSFFNISTRTRMMGFSNEYKIDIDSTYKKELAIKYKLMEVQMKSDWEEYSYASLFQFVLRNQISKALINRKSND